MRIKRLSSIAVILLFIVTLLAIAFERSIAADPTDPIALPFEHSVYEFSSEKELKERIKASEWWEFKVKGKRFLIGRIPLLSVALTRQRFICWSDYGEQKRLITFWDLRLQEAGSVKLVYDDKTSVVSLIGISNNSLKGTTVASLNLLAL